MVKGEQAAECAESNLIRVGVAQTERRARKDGEENCPSGAQEELGMRKVEAVAKHRDRMSEEIAHTVDYLISPLAGFVTVRCFSLRLLICYMFISIIKQCVGSHCPHTIDNATRCCCTG